MGEFNRNVLSDNMTPILVIGLARSGTTWLGKIFDSHPETLYRHEPDTTELFRRLPLLMTPSDGDKHRADLGRFLDSLRDHPRIRASGTWPVFRKSREGVMSFWSRKLGILGLQAIAQRKGNVRIPNWLIRYSPETCRVVWKSVWSVGRVSMLHQAIANLNVVMLVRHPCGIIDSRQRGLQRGKISPVSENEYRVLRNWHSAIGAVVGKRVDWNNAIDREVFRWALLYGQALTDLNNSPRFHVLKYEDLCANPHEEISKLFKALQLPDDRQVNRFIASSTSHKSSRFYSVYRKPEQIDLWRKQVCPDTYTRVRMLIRGTPAGRLYE